jgi:hypothetical protein
VSRALKLDARIGPSALVRAWDDAVNPLPCRTIRAPLRPRHPSPGLGAPPWLQTGTPGKPFDFCAQVRRLCADIVTRSEPLDHVDVSRVLFAVTQARGHRRHGLQARVTPLRFRDGQMRHCRRGRACQVQRYFVNNREMLYVVSFCLPRFLDQDFDDKFITLFHELYHISPVFNGDLRRHAGRCAIHTQSKRSFDEHMAHLARDYLNTGPDPKLHAFLRLNFGQLQERHGSVIGVVVPRPKLIPVAARK